MKVSVFRMPSQKGKKFYLMTSLLVLVFFLIANGCAPNPKAVLNQEKIKKGEEVFNQNCLACHGEKGKGGVGPSLISLEIKKEIEEKEEGSKVELIILKGKGQMPAFEGKISHQDLHSLLDYLLSLSEK